MTKPDHLFKAIDACLANIGQDSWADRFADLARQAGAVQVMVFSYAPAAAACLLSRNFLQKALGTTLSTEYLRGWFRQDPLFSMALEMSPGDVACVDSTDISGAMSEEYRARFYERPGLGGKSAVLAAGSTLRLAVNLYHSKDAVQTSTPTLETILGRLALMHFEAHADADFPATLAVLSERERAVCLGILSGKKAEIIAADLGVAPSTVVTYRTRAYRKLGISSRRSLFVLCGS